MGPAASDDGARLVLLRRAAKLTSAVTELALDHLGGRPTEGFTHLGTGVPEIDATFESVEAATQRVHYGMLPVILFDPWDPARELDRRSRARGVELLTLASERILEVHPLMSSMEPNLRIGEAVTTMFIIDRTFVVLPGPVTGDGAPTAWSASLPEILGQALELWDQVWAASRPAIPPGESAPFSPRQVKVATLMTQGHKDASIARELGVSIRTVVSEVSYLADKLNARSRVEAVLALRRGSQRRKDGNPFPAFE